MSSAESPLHIFITGGEGSLARALQKEFPDDHVLAPGRKAMDVRDKARVDDYSRSWNASMSSSPTPA